MLIDCYQLSTYQKNAIGRPILQNLSCQIQEGEFVAVLGLNGAGKSSLLKTLMGLLPLKQGEIRIQDTLLTPKTLTSLRRYLAMIFQGGGLIRQLSALDNVLCGCLGSRPAWQTLFGFQERDRRIAWELLADLGLKDQVHQKVSKLSGGQQQRVAIARALLQKPQILLADEPIAGLDIVAAQQVMETFSRLNQEQNLTVITVLHDLALAEKYADRALILDQGQIIYDGPAQNLSQHFEQTSPYNPGGNGSPQC